MKLTLFMLEEIIDSFFDIINSFHLNCWLLSCPKKRKVFSSHSSTFIIVRQTRENINGLDSLLQSYYYYPSHQL